MHLSHLPPALLLLLLALAPTALALLDPRPQQNPILDPRSPEARQRRLEAWIAQKPMHTTALLAGAAATAVSKPQLRHGRRRDLSGVTGEKGMWIPVEFWDDGDEGDERRGFGVGVGDVRGEKVLQAELEVELEEEYVEIETETEVEVYGIRDVLERVWRKMEKIGLVVQRKKQQMDKVKALDDGHDGDL